MTAASFNLTGDVNLNGSLVASGTVTDSGAVLATHTHSGVVAGGDNTGSPN
jgi:phage baseplate assembly protein gpV